jgi:hypothetical protein
LDSLKKALCLVERTGSGAPPPDPAWIPTS